MVDGEFKKRFQDIANHTPMGILNDLHMRERNPIYLPESFSNITVEARKEFPKIWLIQDRPYTREEVEILTWFYKWFGDKE